MILDNAIVICYNDCEDAREAGTWRVEDQTEVK